MKTAVWKYRLLTLVVAVMASTGSFALFYRINDQPAVRRAAREGDAMAWLQAEFHLNAAQLAAIQKSHAAYSEVCARHCDAIMAARKRNAPAPELARLERSCVQSMTEHFQQVAALMSPGEGARYLAVVLPRIEGYDHREAPNLQFTR